MTSRFYSALLICLGCCALAEEPTQPLPFEVKLETPVKYNGEDWMWFHPRVAAIPGAGKDGNPAIIMTLQRHLNISDYYSGLYTMRTDDLGKTWSGPKTIPELAWRTGAEGEDISVCDVTPGWHAPTGKVIAIGVQVRYGKQGQQLEDKPGSTCGAYSIYDPATDAWTPWQTLEVPGPEKKFWSVGPGCVQWLVEDGGSLLVPIYFKSPDTEQYSVTTLRCAFDGTKISVTGQGNEMTLAVERGLCEPSLVKFKGLYYMTIRNDQKGYVATSTDGLTYGPMKEWTFDDGSDLGSYNTQQHWLTHGDGLFLTYTRRGADNDFVFRHRAPLFMAQVDPVKLNVIRATEKILMPNRGATFGNFGAVPINETESWVTDAEGMFGEARQRGAEGSVFVARITWPTRTTP
ncbi:MAG: sialidase family protein [Candidatus Hydrogenedentes bacterium]|nr:sialidase family protein [Candidatus Hydrogenedentota bacterium]